MALTDILTPSIKDTPSIWDRGPGPNIIVDCNALPSCKFKSTLVEIYTPAPFPILSPMRKLTHNGKSAVYVNIVLKY